MSRHVAALLGRMSLGVAAVLLAAAPLMAQPDGPPGPGGRFLDVAPGPLMGMLLGMVLLLLLIWGIKQPLAWVVVSFLAIGNGVGCLGYGLAQIALQNSLLVGEPLTRNQIELWSALIGGGVGATVAGIVLLVVALRRRRGLDQRASAP
jgi:hypothetical protein